MERWFDKYQSAPRWMQKLGPLKGYVDSKVYHHTRYKFFDSASGVWLSGSPDGVFVHADGSYVIVDYKTAEYTAAQDKLYPIYAVQLNAYALIGMRTGMFPNVSGLFLIYTEPLAGKEYADNEMNHTNDGFSMGFAANIHHVGLNVDMIPGLLGKVRELYNMKAPPVGRAGCEDCESVHQLSELTRFSIASPNQRSD